MKLDFFSIVTACSLLHTTLGFKARFPPQITFARSANLACLHANPSDDDILQIAVDNVEDDDDFMAMQREMAETIISSTNLPDSSSSIKPATELSGVRNYNNYIAIASAILGSFFFAFQHSQPVSGISLMHAMEHDSVELQAAVCNGKPTIIDFYADWCESCRAMAPSMRSMEAQYKDRINFISIDGSNSKNADMVKRFRVDGIPHLAFIDSNQEVKTALVGSIPKTVLKDEIVALLQGKPMPYEGFDAFEEESHFPLADVSKSCAAAP